MISVADPSTRTDKLQLALDRCVCYPMESVTLSIRVTVPDTVKPLVNFVIPATVKIENIRISEGSDEPFSLFSAGENNVGSFYAIPIYQYFKTGETTEILINLRLNDMMINHYIDFSVWFSSVSGKPEDMSEIPSKALRIRLAVKANADYLRFLPEFYSDDSFMNRFLMLFESFWKPINQQISQVEYYFDPDMTPEAFLPWLCGWLGLRLDKSFPKAHVREMLKAAIAFFHCRGTKHSLETFLMLYSSGQVSITERKAKNFILGETSLLGESIALGSNNQPNSVYIRIKAPKTELDRTGFSEEVYKQKLISLTREIVPAHTVFDLNCDFE